MSEIQITELGGNCPVQAEGTIRGELFYFRARGNRWSLSIGSDPIGSPAWWMVEQYGEGPYDAGWMPEDDAEKFIRKAAALYLAGHAPIELNLD